MVCLTSQQGQHSQRLFKIIMLLELQLRYYGAVACLAEVNTPWNYYQLDRERKYELTLT